MDVGGLAKHEAHQADRPWSGHPHSVYYRYKKSINRRLSGGDAELKKLVVKFGLAEEETPANKALYRRLREQISQCERDTARYVGAGAALALSQCRIHKMLCGLTQFVENCLKSSQGQRNGAKINAHGGLSLEKIVITMGAEVFGAAAVARAKKTLRIDDDGEAPCQVPA